MAGEKEEVTANAPVVENVVGTKLAAGRTARAGFATLAATAATPEANLPTGKIMVSQEVLKVLWLLYAGCCCLVGEDEYERFFTCHVKKAFRFRVTVRMPSGSLLKLKRFRLVRGAFCVIKN